MGSVFHMKFPLLTTKYLYFTTSERLLKVAGINTRRFQRTETGPKQIEIDLDSKSISMSRKSKDDDDLPVNLNRIYF